MILDKDSPLRRLPHLADPREALLVDGIRYAIEMADLVYSRLRSSAHSISLARLRDEQPLAGTFASIFLDAWSVIDSVNRLRLLLGSSLLRKRAEVRGFLAATRAIEDLRHAVQHLDERLEGLAQQHQPAWGSVAWMFGRDLSDHRAWCHVMVAGTTRPEHEHLFLAPAGEIRFPVDRLTLTAHGLTVSLTQTMERVERLARTLENDIRKQAGELPPAGSDLWLSMEVPWGEDEARAPAKLERIRLTVPETAVEAIVQYEIRPAGGKVRLYRTPDDREPIVLEGPGGERKIALSEPHTLYFEFLTGAEHFRLWTAGWKDPR